MTHADFYVYCGFTLENRACARSRSQLASEGQSGMLNHVTMETAGGTCFCAINTWLLPDTGARVVTTETGGDH